MESGIVGRKADRFYVAYHVQDENRVIAQIYRAADTTKIDSRPVALEQNCVVVRKAGSSDEEFMEYLIEIGNDYLLKVVESIQKRERFTNLLQTKISRIRPFDR